MKSKSFFYVFHVLVFIDDWCSTHVWALETDQFLSYEEEQDLIIEKVKAKEADFVPDKHLVHGNARRMGRDEYDIYTASFQYQLVKAKTNDKPVT